MLSSNNNGLNNDLVSYNNDQSISHRPFLDDINPNSKLEEPQSFFHIPSPFIHYDLDLEEQELFLQQPYYDLFLQQQPLTTDDSTVPDIVVNMVDSSKTEVTGLTKDCNKKKQIVCNQNIPMKRPSKKDRHSKINTAKGPRDRRMRLSLEVARKFFDLQDMLGYDKASKTVEWLLMQAKSEINNLERCFPQMNYSISVGAEIVTSNSECDAVSGFDKAAVRGSINSKGKHSVKEKKIRNTRRTTHRPHARALRDKARARARERTRKKMWSRRFEESKLSDEAKAKDLNQLGSLSSFEAGRELGTQSHSKNHSLKVMAEVEEPSSNDRPKLGNQEEMLDDAFVIMGKWSPSSPITYMQTIGISQELQFGDFPLLGKP